jgi:putative hydrolase of HD superfamily
MSGDGFKADDIVENTRKEMEGFSRELGTWEAVKRRCTL